MDLHDPFEHLKHKLWPKEGPGIKLAIWLLTTKSRESPRFLGVQVAYDIPLKISWQGLQLCFRPHLNGPTKSRESKKWEFRDSHLGVPKQNAIWMGGGSWRGIKYTIRGKVVASPKSGLWWVLWVWVYPWLVLTLKVFQLCTNQLVIWFCAGLCEWLSACHSS
jgi:hypothetical protein